MVAKVVIPIVGKMVREYDITKLVEWKAKEGDWVEEGNIFLAVETEKASCDIETWAELGDRALGILGESSYPWQLDTPINRAFVEAIKAKTGVVPSCSEQNAYTMAKMILAGLEATGGDDSFDKLWLAVLALKADTPQGPAFFTSEGVAVTDAYVTQAGKVDDEYRLSAPIAVVYAIRDWRLPE